MSETLEARPQLEQRLKDLNAAQQEQEVRSREVAAEERALAQQKRSLGQRAEDMEKLVRVLDMTKLDLVMEAAKSELDELDKKLGKRRLLWEDLKERRRRSKSDD